VLTFKSEKKKKIPAEFCALPSVACLTAGQPVLFISSDCKQRHYNSHQFSAWPFIGASPFVNESSLKE
jgi:hypothetical protein